MRGNMEKSQINLKRNSAQSLLFQPEGNRREHF